MVVHPVVPAYVRVKDNLQTTDVAANYECGHVIAMAVGASKVGVHVSVRSIHMNQRYDYIIMIIVNAECKDERYHVCFLVSLSDYKQKLASHERDCVWTAR